MKCKYLYTILKKGESFVFFFTKNYTDKEYYMTKFKFNKGKVKLLGLQDTWQVEMTHPSHRHFFSCLCSLWLSQRVTGARTKVHWRLS